MKCSATSLLGASPRTFEVSNSICRSCCWTWPSTTLSPGWFEAEDGLLPAVGGAARGVRWRSAAGRLGAGASVGYSIGGYARGPRAGTGVGGAVRGEASQAASRHATTKSAKLLRNIILEEQTLPPPLIGDGTTYENTILQC